MNIRPAIPPPDPAPTSANNPRYITFCHPGYPEPSNGILRLYAPDLPGQRALDATYAILACGIVTGNRWDGWLTEARDSASPRIDATAALLQRDMYYFHLPGFSSAAASPYPVVPSFQHWSFPEQLPPSWAQFQQAPVDPERRFSQSQLSVAVRSRDGFCRISGCREGLQAAHICPQKEEPWFLRNAMYRFTSDDSNSINSLSNAYLLRTDLHQLHDSCFFVFVPKGNQWVVHLTKPSRELEALYHNTTLHSLNVAAEFLFARWAWTIFPEVRNFLLAGLPRRLQLSTRAEDTTAFTAPQELELIANSPTRRSRSPKKRKPPGLEEVNDEVNSLRRSKRQKTNPTTLFNAPQLLRSSVEVERHIQPKLCCCDPASPPLQVQNDRLSCEPPAVPSSSPPSDGASLPDTPDAMALLRQRWLADQRPSGWDQTRKEEAQWVEEVYGGRVISGDEAYRWLEAQGCEVIHDDNDNDNNNDNDDTTYVNNK